MADIVKFLYRRPLEATVDPMRLSRGLDDYAFHVEVCLRYMILGTH